MTKLYPAWLREWDSSRSGLCYRVYFRDLPDVCGGQNKSMIDAIKTAKDALQRYVDEGNELPDPSAPLYGDIMIGLGK